MDAARDNAADSGNKIGRRRDADDASRGANDVDHVFAAAAGADRVPMRVEGADRNRNAWGQTQLSGPIRGELPGDSIGRGVAAREFFADTREQRVYLHEKF